MGWPYTFEPLPKELRHGRRLTLDRYGYYAQLLVLVPVTIALVFKISAWASRAAKARYQSYDFVPDSPNLKSQRQTSKGAAFTRLRQLQWWLGDDVIFLRRNWGQRDQWVLGAFWGALLLSLCVPETGKDYLHITKRFGIVAASQFPIQYLLALKYWNPFAFVFNSSHETLNRYHRVLGRIIYMLLCLHATWYLNYFIGVGVLGQRLVAPVVLFGIVSFAALSLLYSTALASMRQYSYRLFFLVHFFVSFWLPVVLFFHARPARLYLGEALVVFVIDLITRKINTVTSQASLESIPGTNLIKVSTPMPLNKANRFREHPGSHIYMSFPAPQTAPGAAVVAFPLFGFLFNPFTVAAVNDETGAITVVARQRAGPLTAALAKHARAAKGTGNGGADESATIPLSFEGPYGAATRFPNLSDGRYDRVLLVAGGIGATFAVPLYKAILVDCPTAKVDFYWAVRSAGDATWAVQGEQGGRGILSDKNVHIFLTGDILEGSSNENTPARRTTRAAGRSGGGEDGADGAVEMSNMYADRQGGKYTAQHNRKRPDLKKLVDDAFKHGSEERVAVLVCGPEGMARELRQYVGYWVAKGREVWWHNEGFGW